MKECSRTFIGMTIDVLGDAGRLLSGLRFRQTMTMRMTADHVTMTRRVYDTLLLPPSLLFTPYSLLRDDYK